MFKSNPNFNEYYGLSHQINRKSNKLKRTESSKEKIYHSKKSFSQQSQSDEETGSHKRNKHLQDFMNRRNPDTHKTTGKVNSPESPKEENILDLFKRKDISGEANLRRSVDLYPETRSKKYVGIDYNEISGKKLIHSNRPLRQDLVEYFGDSFDIRHKRSIGNLSKSRSQRNRSQKSPLKMLKSKSRQQLYSPVQKMLNVIKLEQRMKQKKLETEKTVKHINYIRTMNELNETHMNFPGVRYVKSQKKINEFEHDTYQRNKRSNKLQNQELMSSKNHSHSKQEFSIKIGQTKRIKNSESEIYIHMSARQHQSKKISSSKIKKYFNRKEQIEKDQLKMRNILQSVGTKRELAELRKIQSQRALKYSGSGLNASEVSQSQMSSNKPSPKHIPQSEQKIYYSNHRQESRNRNDSVYDYSDYGLEPQESSNYQKPALPSKPNKKFYKTPKREVVPVQRVYEHEVPQSPAGAMIDQIKCFQNSKFKEFIAQSDMEQNVINSMASIEDNLTPKKQKFSSGSQLYASGSKFSVKSSECEINVHGPSTAQYEAQISVNTPAYRHNLTEKKPKQSIISKLKKDIAEDKIKSHKKLQPNDNKTGRKQSDALKKGKSPASSSYLSSDYDLKPKQQPQSNIQSQKNLKKDSKNDDSEIEGLSNLIRSNQNYEITRSPPKIRHDDTWKESKSQFEKSNELRIKNQVLAKVHAHDLSEFESAGSDQKNPKKSHSNSVLNLNKKNEGKSIESESLGGSSQLNYSKKSSIVETPKTEKNGAQSNERKKLEKKQIKFTKVVRKPGQTQVAKHVQKLQESNLESLTDSYQTNSIISSQRTSLKSSGGLTQGKKVPNSNQRISIGQQKSKVIREEQGSEANSTPQSSSIDMSSASSVYTESVKKSLELKKKVTESEYSQSSQSRHPTLNKVRTSKMSQSEQNLSSKSEFSQEPSSHNGSNTISKSSSLSQTSKKLAAVNKFNNLPRNDSNMFKKKKNFAEYTLNDVARYIEEHEFRIEAYSFYIGNSKNTYEEDYELQKIQLLQFLMLKKNLYELNRAVLALQGKGENVFTLTDIEIIDEVLEDYRDREAIDEQRKNMVKYVKLSQKQFKETFESLQKKYVGQKGFNMSLEKDDFSSEIIKKLGQQLNQLYEKWQKNKSHGDRLTARRICQRLEKRMFEIIELIFLTSEIDGKRVKSFENAENQIQFSTYYEKWYERIIETIEYFDSKSKYYN